jgi:hypothetical protein
MLSEGEPRVAAVLVDDRVDRVQPPSDDVQHLALDLQPPVDDQQRMAVQHRPVGLVDLRPHGQVDHAGLVLQRDEDEVLGGHGVLDADCQSRQPNH